MAALVKSGGTGTLSRQFSELLAGIGLATKKDHKGGGHGRDARRTSSGLTFHCLRHTATSLLKNAGVSDAVAMEIIGHDSEAISRVYTHISQDALRKAIKALPDVTEKMAHPSRSVPMLINS
jgi:integrase